MLTSHRIGWGKKLSYCIAFSIDGATDVTQRYVRNWTKYGHPRTRASEEDLKDIIKHIRAKRREKLSNKDKVRLIKEDLGEENELKMYVVHALVAELLAQSSMNPKILAEKGGCKFFQALSKHLSFLISY